MKYKHLQAAAVHVYKYLSHVVRYIKVGNTVKIGETPHTCIDFKFWKFLLIVAHDTKIGCLISAPRHDTNAKRSRCRTSSIN